MRWPASVEDKSLEYIALFYARMKKEFHEYATDDLIEQYAGGGAGAPSDVLKRINFLFAVSPSAGKLALLEEKTTPPTFRLIKLLSSDGRFEVIESVDPFLNRQDGFVEIFRRRLLSLRNPNGKDK
jgi:hypothetical protein